MAHNPAIYEAMFSTERHWENLLRAAYGNRDCDARYDARGISTPDLKRARDAYVAAHTAYFAEYRAQ